MKILFICRANVGRSQMARSFYDNLSSNQIAISAGTKVSDKIVGATLGDIVKLDKKKVKYTKSVIQAMLECGCDISDQRITQLSEETFASADKVIVMCRKCYWPNYLKGSSKVDYWRIEDPKGKTLSEIRDIRDKVRVKVESLI